MAEKSAEMSEAPAETEAPVILPPEDLRCRRSDGNSRRCSRWRIHHKNLCEKHYMQSMAMSANRKSLTSSAGSKGKAKDFQDSKGRGGRGGDGEAGGSGRLRLGSGSEGQSQSQKRRRGRHGDDEESSEEEVLQNKKIRSVGLKERKRKYNLESTEEEEEERSGIKKPKIEAKKAERGCKRETGNGNENNVASVAMGRMRKKAKLTLEKEHVSEYDWKMCHQCMASNKKVVRCRKGYRRSYCGDCLRKW